MSTVIIILLVMLLFLGRPGLVRNLPESNEYLSHKRTNIINAFFIVIIVLRHINQRIVPFSGIDEIYGTYYDALAGQSIVSSFFFFSGYGIMRSIQIKKQSYIKSLMPKRFARLYINTAICCAFSCFAYCLLYLSPAEACAYFLKTMVGLGGYWFIIMTLAIYVLVWISFVVCGVEKPKRAIAVASLLIYMLCVGLLPYKPMWWLDTELCFPCGMLLAVYLPQMEKVVRRIRLPIMLIGFIAMIVGWLCMQYHMYGFNLMYVCILKHIFQLETIHWIKNAYHVGVYPLCTVVMVMGILWFFAGLKWKKEPSFLVWLGGSAVFYIFVLHFIPLRMLQTCGYKGTIVGDIPQSVRETPLWGNICPELVVLAVFVAILLIAYAASLVIPKIDSYLFKSK